MSESPAKNRKVSHETIEPGFEDQRIDNYLLKILKGVPKSYIYRILRKGEVRVNKGRIKADYRLKIGDEVRIPPVRMADPTAAPTPGKNLLEKLENAVIFEDNRLLIMNKPSGMAVHGGSGLSYGVIEALRAIRPDERQLELVHRLDRDTSGCLIIAKKRSALRSLHELLRENRVDKRYLALVAGNWNQNQVEVNQPLKKNTLQGGERVVRITEDGKPAITRFRVIERFRQASLVEARLLTGRTHQIRVHAAYLGTPILGDEKYGDTDSNKSIRQKGLKRLFLHAASLRLRLPDDEKDLFVEAPLDADLQQLLDVLRNETI
ncbi:MAG: 23S rRNA pseudouridine(955/2504/2580) synthase RluC [Sedimenticola sp.]|nr:MAG: 23S rRNA pseudouridine(955/2504/2580) synthase RluC [Sedimenticola sp.]